MKKKHTLKERMQYWFDRRMARGTGSMIFMLSAGTLILILLVGLLIAVLDEESLAAALWDSLATTVNAWMPYSGDGGIGYILLTALAAIVGLFFTSVLIGIFSSAIEDKVTALRSGNSRILEEGHTVILGWSEGAYSLLEQLLSAAFTGKRTIVIAEKTEREELEEGIRANIDLPKNVSVLCRNVNITDMAELACCSLDTASTVIVNCKENDRTVRVLLAAAGVLAKAGNTSAKIVATVTDNDFLLPMNTMREKRIYMLQANDIVARVIAHSATEPGLSQAFTEIFSYEGAEFYVEHVPEAAGKAFGSLHLSASDGIPVGVYRNGQTLIDPEPGLILQPEDDLLTFAEDSGSIRFTGAEPLPDRIPARVPERASEKTVIFGGGELLPRISEEISEYSGEIISAEADGKDEKELLQLVSGADHVILLCDHEADEDEADTRTILLILRLRDLKKEYGPRFNLTVELRKEANKLLIRSDDATEYVVASDLNSAVIAQIAEESRRVGLLRELLSNSGNELYNRDASMFTPLPAEMTVKELRKLVYEKKYLFIGYSRSEGGDRRFVLNPDVNETVRLGEGDSLVVIGEK